MSEILRKLLCPNVRISSSKANRSGHNRLFSIGTLLNLTLPEVFLSASY